MNPETHKTLRLSFIKLTPVAGAIINSFYERLLRENPTLKPLFANVDMATQRTKMIKALAFVVENAAATDTVRPALEQLGKDHVAYGALMAHYPIVATALLEALKDGAQDKWNQDWSQAWSEAIAVVCDTMKSGVAKQIAEKRAKKSK